MCELPVLQSAKAVAICPDLFVPWLCDGEVFTKCVKDFSEAAGGDVAAGLDAGDGGA